MKRITLLFVGLMFTARCMAATHYVVPPGTVGVTATDPYTSWATAGTSISDVVKAAVTNTAPRVVWVTNGTYYSTNRIYVSEALTLQSVNGCDVTTLNGSQNTDRCTYVTASVVFDGFTITNCTYTADYGLVFIFAAKTAM